MGRDPKVAMRTSFGTSRYNRNGEDDFVCYSAPGSISRMTPGLVICHPRASSALGMFADPTWVRLYQALSERFVVSVSDCGGSVPWGNAQTVDAIGKLRSQLINDWGAYNGKIGIVGISMGGLAMFNYAKANPSLVAFCVGIVPAISLASIKSNYPASYGPEIDTAYGGTYSDGTQGPTYSPYVYRNSFPNIKTGIWYSTNDAICLPTVTQTFGASIPNAEMHQIEGAPQHQDAVPPAIEGSPQPADWAIQRLSDTSF